MSPTTVMLCGAGLAETSEILSATREFGPVRTVTRRDDLVFLDFFEPVAARLRQRGHLEVAGRHVRVAPAFLRRRSSKGEPRAIQHAAAPQVAWTPAFVPPILTHHFSPAFVPFLNGFYFSGAPLYHYPPFGPYNAPSALPEPTGRLLPLHADSPPVSPKAPQEAVCEDEVDSLLADAFRYAMVDTEGPEVEALLVHPSDRRVGSEKVGGQSDDGRGRGGRGGRGGTRMGGRGRGGRGAA